MARIRRTPERFLETVHDEGQTDMFAAMRTYQEIGFDGPLRHDHCRQWKGRKTWRPAMTSWGATSPSATSRGWPRERLRRPREAATQLRKLPRCSGVGSLGPVTVADLPEKVPAVACGAHHEEEDRGDQPADRVGVAP
jgi:hypothetical protein